ncbi:MAG: hypothetical protein DWQ09_11610 [Proteobacteria bacterium]|nr:MAG: hypothetical protein DWQ09_11610 [Pseudomonadota bacterium]
MSGFRSSRQQVSGWLRRLAESYTVHFPQPEGSANWNYHPLAPESAVTLAGYRPTIIPPGRHLMPDQEVLFGFRRRPEGGIEFIEMPPAPSQIIAGVRPCDLRAIVQMDAVHADPPSDTHYLRRRAATRIIAFNCLQPCDDRAFCAATGALSQREGADCFVTLIGDEAVIEALTRAGESLLEAAGFDSCEDAVARRQAAEAGRPQPFGRQLEAPAQQMPELLRKAYHSPVWAYYAERCFSCGTCNLVCPTCYCFEVCDEMALGGQSGQRTRTWDGCMVPGFAEVAGGHNFRAAAAERQRHRIKRKFEYLPERFGLGSFCVGCGRCGRQCTTDIDIFDMVNDIAREACG